MKTNILWHIIAAKSSAVKDFSGMESTGQIKLNSKIVYSRRHGVDEKNICIADVGLFFLFFRRSVPAIFCHSSPETEKKRTGDEVSPARKDWAFQDL
ncbi:MAG: hypothetical protein LKE98_11390 [Lachnospiraceae bacterium]|nr:hypothetical protein [Lachnospiraceae bacterium]